MHIFADIFFGFSAFGAGLYCFILARRLAKFNDLDTGIGGAVALLSAQVDALTKTLIQAQDTALESTTSLSVLTERAEVVAKRLELMIASMHDLPDQAVSKPSKTGKPEIVFPHHPIQNSKHS